MSRNGGADNQEMGRTMIVFDCSVCGKQLKVKDEVGGKTVRCSHCGGKVAVPLSEKTAVKASSARTAEEGATLPPSGRPASVKASSARPAEEGATVPPSGRPHSETATEHTEPESSGSEASEGPEVPGYEILGELGRGGLGVVYKARHLRLKRLVALKMIRAGGSAGDEELARFRAEAEAVARMQHPNIVQVFEVGDYEGQP